LLDHEGFLRRAIYKSFEEKKGKKSFIKDIPQFFCMELTKRDRNIIKVIIEKELESLEADFKKLTITNSPFLGKVARDESDLAFMKSELDYKKYLEKLILKL